MIDIEKLKLVLAGYKVYFPNHFGDEKYKWEAVQHFQAHWDINAENFGDMFKQATGKTLNLLASGYAYPREMITRFAKADDKAVRQMFCDLFDESKDLAERVKAFQNTSAEIQVKYDDGTWKNHYQNANAISTYLWLKYPDKYYIYRYELFRDAARELSADYTPLRNGSVETMLRGFAMYDEICEVISYDGQLRQMLTDALTDSCYSDPAMKTATMDVGFYLSRFYLEKGGTNMEEDGLESDAKVVNWMGPLVETLIKMGGGGKRPDVHERIQKDYPVSETEREKRNSNGTLQVLNDIDWARNYLVYEGFISKEKRGFWELTDTGKSVVMTKKLAGKIFAEWIRIKAAERKHQPLPEIDITPYYTYRTEQGENGYPKYSKEDFLKAVYMSEAKYDVLEMLLKNKKNVILQGAPGVGKTFTAKRLAYAMMGGKDDSRIEMVQFHQNYSYEDFIMGYRPKGDGFELTNGIFFCFCEKAEKHREKPYFFIIDEINRGNMSKIFGELLMLIERDYRGTEATLAYSGKPFSVPENLYIIGMMNTADRSLAMIDYALRRRFSFFEMEPGFGTDGFTAYQNSLDNETFNALVGQIQGLNKEIADDPSLGRGFCIGHSYFCGRKPGECTNDWMCSVVEFDILPMLSEYWFDEPTKLQRWEKNLHGVFHDQ